MRSSGKVPRALGLQSPTDLAIPRAVADLGTDENLAGAPHLRRKLKRFRLENLGLLLALALLPVGIRRLQLVLLPVPFGDRVFVILRPHIAGLR